MEHAPNVTIITLEIISLASASPAVGLIKECVKPVSLISVPAASSATLCSNNGV